MTQPPYPPSVPYSDPSLMPSRRSNGWALASLICGILGCIPLSQLLAIVFGIVGIRKSSYTHSGKGMAIAGIILGLLFTLGWVGCGGTAAVVYVKSRPVVAKTHSFLEDAAAGNTSQALAQCTSGVTAVQINGFADAVKPHGAVKDITAPAFNVDANSGSAIWVVTAIITFTDGQTETAQLSLTKVADEYKVTKFVPNATGGSMAAPAATTPAQPDQTP